MSVVPWDRFDADESPFVMLFSLAGLGAAAHLVNPGDIVILIAYGQLNE